MDNSPPWDAPLARVTHDAAGAYRRTDTVLVDGEQRPTAADYDAYVALITEMRTMEYDPAAMVSQCTFKVADAATNAIAARAGADLSTLGHILGHDTAEIDVWAAASAEGLQRLWHSEQRHFLSSDLRQGAHLQPATSASMLALWSGTLTENQVDVLCEHLEAWEAAAGGLVPSSDPSAPTYDPFRYWRGPVWVNVNWMVAEGLIAYGRLQLAERIRTYTAKVVEGAGMREYFHPATGEGLGAEDFSWTAALARYWLGMA